MGIELGRISGPLLASNLVRKNSGAGEENLAFENDLLFLDVINDRIGVHTDTPTRTFQVVGTTNLQDDLQVDNQLDVANFTALGHEISTLTGNITIRPNQSVDPEVVTDRIGTANLRISDKLIENITTDSDINFTANGSGLVQFTTSKINVNGDLHSTGNITFDGSNITFGTGADDNIEFKSDIDSHFIPDVTNTYDLGSVSQTWHELFANSVSIGTTQTANLSVIQTLVSNGSNEFYGSSNQFGLNSSVLLNLVSQVDSNIVPTGTRTLGASSYRWNNLYVQNLDTVGTFAINNLILNTVGTYISVPNIKIQNDEISVTATNTDLNLLGAGLGGVILDEYLKFKDTEISNVKTSPTSDTQKSIFLTPDGIGQVVLNTTKTLVLPLGNISTRSLSTPAELRYNTDSNLVEGYAPSGRINLNNLYDSDRNTYITPELTPGASDDTLRFGINGIQKATITPTALKTNTMHVDDVNISGTTIAPITTSNDLTFVPSGTGSLDVNSILFKDNTITNTLNTALTFVSTGAGYVKFTGSGAVAIPYGTDAERPAGAEAGELRYSTDQGYLEVYDGITWIPSSGTSLAASQAEVEEIMNLWAIILG